jgi:hypothetical protein
VNYTGNYDNVVVEMVKKTRKEIETEILAELEQLRHKNEADDKT